MYYRYFRSQRWARFSFKSFLHNSLIDTAAVWWYTAVVERFACSTWSCTIRIVQALRAWRAPCRQRTRSTDQCMQHGAPETSTGKSVDGCLFNCALRCQVLSNYLCTPNPAHHVTNHHVCICCRCTAMSTSWSFSI